MPRFEGDKTFPLPPAELWAKLTDAHFLVQCLPDVESITTVESDHAVLAIRPKLGFVSGKLDVDLRIIDQVAPTSAKLVLASKGIGSSSKVEVGMRMEAKDAGSLVHWVAEITELGGLLKLVPGGLIQGAAQAVIKDVMTRVEEALAKGG